MDAPRITIVGPDNNYGLSREKKLLADALAQAGVPCHRSYPGSKDPVRTPIVVFLEVSMGGLFATARGTSSFRTPSGGFQNGIIYSSGTTFLSWLRPGTPRRSSSPWAQRFSTPGSSQLIGTPQKCPGSASFCTSQASLACGVLSPSSNYGCVDQTFHA